MNDMCQKCGGPFSDGFCYHNPLNNQLWCLVCSKENSKYYSGYKITEKDIFTWSNKNRDIFNFGIKDASKHNYEK